MRAATSRANVFDVLLVVEVVLLFALCLLSVLPSMFGWSGVVVSSGSMSPAIETGDFAFIDENASIDDVQLRDIVAFDVYGRNNTEQNSEISKDDNAQVQICLHRVVSLNEARKTLVTKGDANDTADGKEVDDASFVGIERVSIPKLGFLVESVVSNKSTVAIVVVITFLMSALLRLKRSNTKLHRLDKSQQRRRTRG